LTSYVAGTDATLTGQFLQYPAGPGQDVDTLTIQIARVGGPTAVGPTTVGISHLGVGLYAFTWSIPAIEPAGDYGVLWQGIVGSDNVQASEVITVTAPAVAIDYSTTPGRVRLLIPDVDAASPLFSDDQITAFLTMEAGNIRLAAATALDVAASSEVMVSKVIRTQDLQTDGAKVAAELRARAATLREQAANYDPDGNLFAMDIVDFNPARWVLGDHELTEPPWCP
jgi:hypothetical protein